MAKLPRILARQFASGAGVDQIGVFGSKFAGAPATTTNPATAQSLSNWLTGWLGAAIGGNAPAIEDMNAFCFVMAYQIAYIMQAGVPEWDTDTIYFDGSIVQVAGELFESIDDDNQGNAITDGAFWIRYGSRLSQYMGSQSLVLTEQMIEFNATLGACTGTLPAANATGAKGKKLVVTKTDATANAVTITDGVYSIDLLSQYDSVTLFSNGSVWYAI